MRRWISLFCVILLILLAMCLPRLRGALPLETGPLIAEKYGGWSGVLRLWIHEGWPVGGDSIAPWLNGCIDRFEKRHPGVYIQPEYVNAAAFADIGGGSLLPDMLLMPPGLCASSKGLAALTLNRAPRPEFQACGRTGEMLFAVPVLAGGYLWAFNTAMLDGVPGSWREAGQPISMPADEPWRQWSAALLALCSARWSEAEGGAAAKDAPGELDLGLSAEGITPTPAPTPVPAATLDCLLPEDFSPGEDAWQWFINGEIAAMPVTQREIRRLERLSEQGKGPDWRVAAAGDGAFTDQLLLAAVVEPAAPDEDAASRQALCNAFIDDLLGDECQSGLHRIGAFSVTDAPSGYAAGDCLAAMEQRLRAGGLAVPPCFDADWKRDADSIVRKFIVEGAAPAPLWRALAARLVQKAEH